MIVKICGMRDAENIREVECLNIDWMGFIFWSKSSRYVSERPAYLPTKVKRVGVFVNANMEEVKQKVEEYGLNIIQLHGQESPAYIHQLRSLCGDRVAAIIKAFNIATEEDLAQTDPYKGIADYFLFDAKAQLIGGNGTKFDWSVLDNYKDDTPFLLSGGIGPDDAERICDWFSAGNGSAAAKCIGIDLNSRFETAPALKDVDALRIFLSHLPTNPINPSNYEQDQ